MRNDKCEMLSVNIESSYIGYWVFYSLDSSIYIIRWGIGADYKISTLTSAFPIFSISFIGRLK